MRLLKTLLLIGLVLAMLQPPYLQALSPSVWEVMREDFQLDHRLNRLEVQKELQWLSAHPGYLTQLNESRPYIYHIVTEIKKRGLPGEMALIPLIESSYDPFAYSHAGAAGLWQLMPLTGKELGLKQDWWRDSRRSITPSTQAALDYFDYLHHTFNGNWDLAIAAYDAGEGTVSRAIKYATQQRKATDFWSLALPLETQHYLPRLLALAEIIAHPNRYHLTLPYIPHTPYFEEIHLKTHLDLNHAAALAGMSYRELIKLNPEFNRWTTSPYQPFKLLLPTDKVDRFYQNLELYAFNNQEDLKHFTVHTTPPKKPQFTTVPPVLKALHIVGPNETLVTIARTYHTTPQQIMAWNHLATETLSRKQQLIIWKATA